MELLRGPTLSVSLLLCLAISLAPIALGSGVSGDEHGGEDFTEELLLKPLPDRKVLAHFHFESRAPRTQSYGRHHHLFPKAISQLVKKFEVREMELSFTQGRWNYETWGGYDPISSSNAKPPGVELWAVFDVPPDQVDASWRNLTHTLSGLFCASINFLESSTMYSSPEWAFHPAPGSLRYGTLPREAVCTENLTPWLKLLPCRDKAGISSLMDRPSIYRGFYHSQRLRLRSVKVGVDGTDPDIVLEQTLTVVFQPKGERSLSHSVGTKLAPSWSLSTIFGRKVSGQCVLAKSSNIYLHLEKGLIAKLQDLHKTGENVRAEVIANEDFLNSPAFKLSSKPDWIFREVVNLQGESSSLLYGFSVRKNGDPDPSNLGLTWKIPVAWSSPEPPLHATRFLMGSGNERGAIAISLRTTRLGERLVDSSLVEERCTLPVNVFQVVPWYVKVYFHTLKVFIDEQPQALGDVIQKIRVSPSEDKVSPGLMEVLLKLPCNASSASLTLEFDKGFLHIDEYPPDANQGFDIPSAIITLPHFEASMHFDQDSSSPNLPLLSRFKEKNPVRSYTEVLLVPLTTPDFSMPYNVITITCTVFALYFGSLLNVLRRRVGEEERLLKTKGKKPGPLSRLLSKLSAKLRGKKEEEEEEEPQTATTSSSLISSKLIVKVILVAAVAVGWQFYSG